VHSLGIQFITLACDMDLHSQRLTEGNTGDAQTSQRI